MVFVNNATYGMTGGQMAPTTLPQQRSTSTPEGRDPRRAGHPMKVCELLASQDGPAYIARVAVNSPANVARAKAAIRKAFRTQQAALGFSLVEVLSTCPTNWGLSPHDALIWVKEHMLPYYPLGEYKVTEAVSLLAQ